MSDVTLKTEGAIAVLTLENPNKLNALTMQMLTRLEAHLIAIEHDTKLRAVIVTGSGPKAFCCGADIVSWGHLAPAEFARHWIRDGHRVFDRLARLCKPVIGAINGHALGGGLELAACCDIRVMGSGATLGLPEARIGIIPGWSGTQRLARLLPEPVIKEMALFGRRIDAARATQLGFATQTADDALALALDMANEACALSPRAVEIAKAMIHAGAGEDAAAAIEALGSAAVAATADRAEGVASFLEKRKPEFPGT